MTGGRRQAAHGRRGRRGRWPAAALPVVLALGFLVLGPGRPAAAGPTGCEANDVCSLQVVVGASDSGCPQGGCPTGDQVTVTALGTDAEQLNGAGPCTAASTEGCYVPPDDFIVIYEVPASGSDCSGVGWPTWGSGGTTDVNDCNLLAQCPLGQGWCSVTLGWNAPSNGADLTHVFEAWTVDGSTNTPDYCSGKTPFLYETSYLYADVGATRDTGSGQLTSPQGYAEDALSEPDGTPLSIETDAVDRPFFDSLFSVYQCPSDASTPYVWQLQGCTLLPSSFTYDPSASASPPYSVNPAGATFEQPSAYPGCNSGSIPPEPTAGWPSPLTLNGPYAEWDTTEYFISSQAVYITDYPSGAVCMGDGTLPWVGYSAWLSVSWYCPDSLLSIQPVSGSGQSALDGQGFAEPLAAVVVNGCTGNPDPGAAVTFSLPTSDASFPGGASTDTETTGADGIAVSAPVTAGDTPATYTATASAAGHTADFALANTCNPAWATGLVPSPSSSPQTTDSGTAFPQPLAATVLDQCGTPLTSATASVTFTVPSQYASFWTGSLPPPSTDTQPTSAATGVATSATVEAQATPAAIGQYLGQATASGPGPFGSSLGPVDYDLTNTCNAAIPASLSAAGGTPQATAAGERFAPLKVTALDQCGTPWAGGTVEFSGPPVTADTAATVPGAWFGTTGAAGTGPTTDLASTTDTGAATSSAPVADDAVGTFVVQATVAAFPSVPAVSFDLSIYSGSAAVPPVFPTAARRPLRPAAPARHSPPRPWLLC